MLATYFIPAPLTDILIKKLKALSRRAAKLSAPPIAFDIVHQIARPHTDPDRRDAGEMLIYDCVTIQGQAPMLQGWRFVAALDHEVRADGSRVNIVRSHGDTDDMPQRFRDSSPDHCDHCGTRRRRRNTFVVRHDATGEWKQVGRQCLKDFAGYNQDPATLANYSIALWELDDTIERLCREGGGEMSTPQGFDLSRFLSYTVRSIAQSGWVSRGVARDRGCASTASEVLAFLSATTELTRQRHLIELPTDADRAVAEAALVWLGKQDPDSEYTRNCQAIASLGWVTWANAGYAASIVSSYQRAASKAAAPKAGTAHVGAIGKREEFRLVLVQTTAIEGHYGTSHLHTFVSDRGATVVWFASNPRVVPGDHGKERMQIGCGYRVCALVKNHGHYGGTPQTQVTRLTVLPLAQAKKSRHAPKGS